MRDLLDVLDVDTATVVGHSLGGGVAAQFAYQYPERCERLVLVASGGVGPEVNPVLRLASLPGADLALVTMQLPTSRLAMRAVMEVLRRTGTDLGRDSEHLARVIDGMPDAAARGAFARTLRSVVDWRGQVVTMRDRAYLTEDVPVMLIWGDRDGVIPVRHAQLAADAMPSAELHVYEGAGHFPHHARPEQFVDHVVDFVATTRPATHVPASRRARLRTGPVEGSSDAGAPELTLLA
jgi:pimeloyl-ACP methyl ester carboxylesterase